MAAIRRALSMENIVLNGLHCHIGSQIFELDSYNHCASVMMDFCAGVYNQTGWIARELDLGGGLGIYYSGGDRPPRVREYADNIMRVIDEKARLSGLATPRVIVEPGRSICGPAGTTLYTVGAIKEIPGIRTYVAVDGGMGDNPRPALYQARYEACLANKITQEPVQLVSVAGKCCESGDMLIWDIKLPCVEAGDVMAVSCTGAYNYAMSMNYNRLPRPAMVLVYDGLADLILERETYEDIIGRDRVPERLVKRDRQLKNIASAG